jgi:hypothetical protein
VYPKWFETPVSVRYVVRGTTNTRHGNQAPYIGLVGGDDTMCTYSDIKFAEVEFEKDILDIISSKNEVYLAPGFKNRLARGVIHFYNFFMYISKHTSHTVYEVNTTPDGVTFTAIDAKAVAERYEKTYKYIINAFDIMNT